MQKSLKNLLFFGTSSVMPFGMDCGRVLGIPNRCYFYFCLKMEAKNEKNFAQPEDRILRPQEQIADEVRRSVRVWGKEHRMGGRPFRKDS